MILCQTECFVVIKIKYVYTSMNIMLIHAAIGVLESRQIFK